MEKYFDKVKIGSQEIGIAAQKLNIQLGTQIVDYVQSGTNNIRIGGQGFPPYGGYVSKIDIVGGTVTLGTKEQLVVGGTSIVLKGEYANVAVTGYDVAINVGSKAVKLDSDGFTVTAPYGTAFNISEQGNDCSLFYGSNVYGTNTIRIGNSGSHLYLKGKTIEEWCGGGVRVLDQSEWVNYYDAAEVLAKGGMLFAKYGNKYLPLVQHSEYNLKFKDVASISNGTVTVLNLRPQGWQTDSE